MNARQNVYDDLESLTFIRKELNRMAAMAESPHDAALAAAVRYLIERAIDEDEALIAAPVQTVRATFPPAAVEEAAPDD